MEAQPATDGGKPLEEGVVPAMTCECELGVDPKAAQDRVATLTDAEARALAGNLQSVPAGADAAGVIVVLLIAGAVA